MKTGTRFIVLSILICIMFEPLVSQETNKKNINKEKISIKYPNIIKINTLAIPFNNISLLYERGIISRLSVGIGISYRITGDAPKMFTNENSTINAQFDKIKGYSIAPGARYYLKTCEPSLLEGFYAGLYLKYLHYNTGVNFQYNPEGNPEENYQADMTMNEYGIGIQLGYQLMLWERFSIDFLFFGPRFSRYTLNYEFTTPPSQQFLDDLSENLNDIVDRFGMDYKVDIEQKGSHSANTSFSFANMRFGLSLGFAF